MARLDDSEARYEKHGAFCFGRIYPVYQPAALNGKTMAAQTLTPTLVSQDAGEEERRARGVLDLLHDVGQRLKAHKQETARLSAKANALLNAGREAKLTHAALAREMGVTRASIFHRTGGKQGLRGTSNPKTTSAATTARQAEVKAQLQAIRTDIEDNRRQGELLDIEASKLIGVAYGLGLTWRQVGAAMGNSNVARLSPRRSASSGPDRPRNRAEAWEASCAAYSSFVAAHGHHPGHEDAWEGLRIGKWADRQRTLRNSGRLTEERVAQLDSLGFAWDGHAARRERFLSAYLSFVASEGETPERHEKWEDLGVGIWAEGQREARRKGRMPAAVFKALDEAGFCWESAKEVQWQKSFEAYSRFVEREGRTPGPGDVENGILVWHWATKQKHLLSSGALKDEAHQRQLESLGFRRGADVSHSHAARWEAAFAAYSSFVEAHGRSPHGGDSWAGINVGQWAGHQRADRKWAKQTLSPERIARLDEIGFEWSPACGRRPLSSAGD